MMSIAEFLFKGPFKSLKAVKEAGGVLVIMCEFSDIFYLLDVNSSSNIKEAIQDRIEEDAGRGIVRVESNTQCSTPRNSPT